MSEIDDGGAAFPVPENTQAPEHSAYGQAGHPGMTLRDWFAGQAMAAIVSRIIPEHRDGATSATVPQAALDAAAHTAFGFADAMIAQRSK
jgi:hypothetical protein